MPSSFIVFDRNGLRGIVETQGGRLDETEQVEVRWENGQETVIRAGTLVAQSDGTYSLPFASTGLQDALAESITVPVLEEQLDIGKRVVNTGGGVRVHKVVHEHEELIDQPLLVQEVDVQRVPIGEVVDGPVGIRHAGDTMIVPVLEERLVIQKQLILKEEIHITRRQLSDRKPQRVMVRTEEARIERLGPAADPDANLALEPPSSVERPISSALPAEETRTVKGGSILDRVFAPSEKPKHTS